MSNEKHHATAIHEHRAGLAAAAAKDYRDLCRRVAGGEVAENAEIDSVISAAEKRPEEFQAEVERLRARVRARDELARFTDTGKLAGLNQAFTDAEAAAGKARAEALRQSTLADAAKAEMASMRKQGEDNIKFLFDTVADRALIARHAGLSGKDFGANPEVAEEFAAIEAEILAAE